MALMQREGSGSQKRKRATRPENPGRRDFRRIYKTKRGKISVEHRVKKWVSKDAKKKKRLFMPAT